MSAIPLRVLGDRVLIKPDVDANAPEVTPSGVVLAKSLAAAVTGEDAEVSVSRGTVIAVGQPRHPLWQETETLAAALAKRARPETVEADAVALLRDLVRRQPAVAVGDDVLFSHDAGQQITMESDTYIICHEHELLAVVDQETEAA